MKSSVVPIPTAKVAKPKPASKTVSRAVPRVFALRVELAEYLPTIWRHIEIDI